MYLAYFPIQKPEVDDSGKPGVLANTKRCTVSGPRLFEIKREAQTDGIECLNVVGCHNRGKRHLSTVLEKKIK